MDYKKIFERFEGKNIFVKTTVPSSVEGSDKAALNRKGNMLYNSGDIEGARRIFMTTGYSDGLSRVGDYYKSQNRLIEALRMYRIAPDRNKAEPLIEQLAGIIKVLIEEPQPSPQGEGSPLDNGESAENIEDAGDE
ncbi:MAG: hypothetical protein LBC52_06185 [Treponema sp.]|jgi:hypothetical protein|nr:hypothetical protein [Treponema sp.]